MALTSPALIEGVGVRGRILTDALRRLIVERGNGDYQKGAAILMRPLFKAAAAGKPWAIAMVLDRIEGKAIQTVITQDASGSSQLADVDLLRVIEGETTVAPSRKRAKLPPPPPSAADGTPASPVPGRATAQDLGPESGE